MENPFNGDDGQILEGFLCPICRADLKSLEFLTEHVEKEHTEEEDAIKSIFKDIFSIAKKKIKINFNETNFDLSRNFEKDVKINDLATANVFHQSPQTIGVHVSHISYFNEIRNPRLERYASETNKLIIRLHKLLKNRPSDPVQRKIHEQKTVPWLDGKLVNLCPGCAKTFYLARRQHHCRLCGSIMCEDCSQFLHHQHALELASLATVTQNHDSHISEKENQLNSIRTCQHCFRLLDARKEMLDSRSCRPPITVYYNDIQNLKKEIIPDIEMYLKIINSLYEGESVFTIADASALRGKIGRVAEVIDLTSKKIYSISCQEGSRQEALKKSIRLACIQFIKDNMLSLPQLPVEAEVKKIQEKRRIETEQKYETERRLALEAYEKYGLAETSSISSTDTYASGSAVQLLDNWSSHRTTTTTSTIANDPLIEQINIIKGYIKQARSAMRFDEVATLEINLRELQNEFYNRHQQKSN